MNIRLDNVSYTYRRGTPVRKALTDVNLEVRSGECLGIIGREGAGKSTLLYSMDALLVPDSGSVRIDGTDVCAEQDLAPLRRRIGLGFQFPEQQFVAETIEDEILLGIARADVTSEQIHSSLAEANLPPDKFLHRSPFSLSMGEARRLALASILIRRPELVLLDEPTVGLDESGTQYTIDRLVEEQENGTTIVIVSHDLNLLAELATRLLVIDEGSVLLDDGIEALLGRQDLLRRSGYEVPGVVQTLNELVATGKVTEKQFLRPRELRALLR